MTSAQFFAALSTRTQPFNQQPFFVRLDGTIVSKIDGNCFKLWQRNNNGCAPVVVGDVESNGNRLIVSWSSRLPLPHLVAFPVMGLFFVYIALSEKAAGHVGMLFGGLLMLSLVGGLLLYMWNRSEGPRQEIANLLTSIGAPQQVEVALRSIPLRP